MMMIWLIVLQRNQKIKTQAVEKEGGHKKLPVIFLRYVPIFIFSVIFFLLSFKSFLIDLDRKKIKILCLL
jgi:hypothetical protein